MDIENIVETFINGNISEVKENITTIEQYRKVVIFLKEYYTEELDRFLKINFDY